MTQQPVTNQNDQVWYARPVLFVADVTRAARFYIDMLGFQKHWHEGDGAGTGDAYLTSAVFALSTTSVHTAMVRRYPLAVATEPVQALR